MNAITIPDGPMPKEIKDQLVHGALDIDNAVDVHVKLREDRTAFYVFVDDVCVLRVSRVHKLTQSTN